MSYFNKKIIPTKDDYEHGKTTAIIYLILQLN
jgi:hypothetical protein